MIGFGPVTAIARPKTVLERLPVAELRVRADGEQRTSAGQQDGAH